MTEEEAKKAACPQARYFDPGNGSGPKCVASTCIAWRWLPTHDKDPANPTGDLIRTTRTQGTCGLAGPWFQNYDNWTGRDQ